MIGKYKIVTLCGSTRFRDEFLEAQKKLTLEGYIVLTVGLFGHAGDKEVWEGMDEGTVTRTKEMLDDMHRRKIDLSDGIFVINKNGYIGDSTRSEIAYAVATGKQVRFLEPAGDSAHLSCRFFWHEFEKDGCFSHWYEAPFVLNDFQYRWAEQYLASQKAVLFHDAAANSRILRADTPAECKSLGRTVIGFNENIWAENREKIMEDANRAKFSQNPALLQRLLSTGDEILGYASPVDLVWGIGMKASAAQKCTPDEWPGKNLLGKILMKLREEFLHK
ncbi:MAG: NADAR family protein [Lachnospiraceae bacterium]|jgi:ribA/ribD-fused uncharacterized protein